MAALLSEHSKKVMEFLLSGHLDQAEHYVLHDVDAEINKLRTDLNSAERERTLLLSMISLAKREDHVNNARKATKQERREAIKRVARDVARRKHGDISVQEVIDELSKQGWKIPGKVPGTVVGNVLFKDGAWKRVEKGVFRLTE